MRKSLIFLKRPYMYGLAVLLFVIASVGLLSKPLFIPEDNAAQEPISETSDVKQPDEVQLMTIEKIRGFAAADGNGEAVMDVKLHEAEGADAEYRATLEDGSVLRYDAVTGKLILPRPTAQPSKADEDTPVSSEPADEENLIEYTEGEVRGTADELEQQTEETLRETEQKVYNIFGW